jgi:hypothetical protein
VNLHTKVIYCITVEERYLEVLILEHKNSLS